MLLFTRLTFSTTITALIGLANAYVYTTPNGVSCDTARPGIGFPTDGSTVYLYMAGPYAAQVQFNMTLCGTSYDGDGDSSVGAMFLLSLGGGGSNPQTEYVLDRDVPQREDESNPNTYPGVYYEETVGVRLQESSAAPEEGEMRNITAYEYFQGHGGEYVTIQTISATFTYNSPPAVNSTMPAATGTAAATAVYSKRGAGPTSCK